MAYEHVRYNKNGRKTITYGRKTAFGNYKSKTYTTKTKAEQAQADLNRIKHTHRKIESSINNIVGTRFAYNVLGYLGILLISGMLGLFPLALIAPPFIRLIFYKPLNKTWYEFHVPSIIERNSKYMSKDVYLEIIEWNKAKIKENTKNKKIQTHQETVTRNIKQQMKQDDYKNKYNEAVEFFDLD